jgi:hypothetical protein
MAKKASKAKAAPKTEKKPAEKVASAAAKAGQTLRESATKAMKNTAKLNSKVIDHAEANAKEAFSTMRKVAGAGSVQDVVKIQAQFVREQGARSASQVREIGDMIASFGRDALAAMRGK